MITQPERCALGRQRRDAFPWSVGLSVKLKTVIDSLCMPLYAGDWNVHVWRRAEKVQRDK